MSLEEKARKLATAAHTGQFRKDGITPYITHPEAVVSILRLAGISDEDIICAAWLHDVIEDSKITERDIAGELNPNIARIVGDLTKDVKREEYLKRISEADYEVQIVKLADVIHNCSTLYDGLPEKTIRRKVEDCDALYLGLARKTSPWLYDLLSKHISPWKEYLERKS